MSLQEYQLLPFHPGWKVELIDGEARFAPREAVAFGVAELALREVSNEFALRPVVREDAEELGRAFDGVFADAVEYCGWSPESFAKERGRVIDGFFAAARGAVLPASRVALAAPGGAGDGAIVGAALIAGRGPDLAQLDLLFVLPAWRRRGLAMALVATAMNALVAAGKQRLIATWHLANEPAIAWYRRMGFVEEPDWMNARLYLRAAEQELYRMEKMGRLDDGLRQTLVAERTKWEETVTRLEALMDAGDYEGAMVARRFHRSR